MGMASVCQSFGCSFGEQGAKSVRLVAMDEEASVELLAHLESLLIVRAKCKDPVDDAPDKAIKNTRWMCQVGWDV